MLLLTLDYMQPGQLTPTPNLSEDIQSSVLESTRFSSVVRCSAYIQVIYGGGPHVDGALSHISHGRIKLVLG